jgi:hypothetical protein
MFAILQFFANRYRRPLWLTEFDCKSRDTLSLEVALRFDAVQ